MAKNVMLLMMAGNGKRCNIDIPKQFYLINKKPIFSYVLKELDGIKCINKIVVVVGTVNFCG